MTKFDKVDKILKGIGSDKRLNEVYDGTAESEKRLRELSKDIVKQLEQAVTVLKEKKLVPRPAPGKPSSWGGGRGPV